jgi:hypothetical protein
LDQDVKVPASPAPAHGSIKEIRGDLTKLNERIHRLRAEEHYFQSVKEEIMPALPFILDHAEKLSSDIRKCYGSLGHVPAT